MFSDSEFGVVEGLWGATHTTDHCHIVGTTIGAARPHHDMPWHAMSDSRRPRRAAGEGCIWVFYAQSATGHNIAWLVRLQRLCVTAPKVSLVPVHAPSPHHLYSSTIAVDDFTTTFCYNIKVIYKYIYLPCIYIQSIYNTSHLVLSLTPLVLLEYSRRLVANDRTALASAPPAL